MPSTTWLKTIQQDLKSNNLLLNTCRSESSTLEIDVYVWHYAFLVVHDRDDSDDDEALKSSCLIIISVAAKYLTTKKYI